MSKRMAKLVKRLAVWSVPLGTLFILFAYGWIHNASRGKIYHQTGNSSAAYTGILLGSRVFSNNQVSYTVKTRCDKAIDLYRSKKIKRVLISGDHGRKDYDEVNTMKCYWSGCSGFSARKHQTNAGKRGAGQSKSIFGSESALAS